MSRRRKGSEVRSIRRAVYMEPHVWDVLRKLRSKKVTPSDLLAKVAHHIQNGTTWDPTDLVA